MRSALHKKLVAGRLRTGQFWSDDSHGPNGFFMPKGGSLKEYMAYESKEES